MRIHNSLLWNLMTFWKCIFNDSLKNVFSRGTPEFYKWPPRVPRHPGWERHPARRFGQKESSPSFNASWVFISSRVSNSNCSEGQMRTNKATEGHTMTPTQQRPYLYLTRNSFCILFPAKKIMRMGNSFLAVSTFVWKELVHSLAEHFQTPVNKANNVNVLITVFENSQKTARPACLRPLVQLAARLLWFSPILLLFSAFSGNFPFYRHVTNVTDLFLNSRLRKVEVFIPQIDSHHLKNWYKNLKTFTSQGNWTSLLPAAVHCSFAPLFHLLQRIAAHLQRVPLWVSRET